jgi:peptidoglycan/LPS O-acetylase OafA/YrhL
VFPAMTQVTWSVSTEWFFYCCYPILCTVLVRLRRPKTILGVVAAVIVVGYASVIVAHWNWGAIDAFSIKRFGQIEHVSAVDSFRFWLFYLSPYFRLFEFVLGCLAAALFMALQRMPISKRELLLGQAAMAIALGGIAVIYALLYYSSSGLISVAPVLRMYFGFAPFMAVLLFCCARYETWVSAALSRRRMILCGEASYSIYLLHIGIVQYVQMFGVLAHVPPLANDVWGVLHGLVGLGLVAMTVIGLSLVTCSVIEMPARRALRRLFIHRPSPSGP